MTRFEELCNAAGKNSVEADRLKNRCYLFASELKKGLVEFLQVPKGRAGDALVKEGQDPQSVPVVEQSTYIKDGWWHTGMQMNLSAADPMAIVGTLPGPIIFVNFIYRPFKDHFIVTFAKMDKETKINDATRKQDFQGLYQFFFDSLKSHFETSVDAYLENKPSRFGFAAFEPQTTSVKKP